MNAKDRLKSTLIIMDINEVKPNYAALVKKYDMDWRTVENIIRDMKTRDKPSALDNYKTIIAQKLSIQYYVYNNASSNLSFVLYML